MPRVATAGGPAPQHLELRDINGGRRFNELCEDWLSHIARKTVSAVRHSFTPENTFDVDLDLVRRLVEFEKLSRQGVYPNLTLMGVEYATAAMYIAENIDLKIGVRLLRIDNDNFHLYQLAKKKGDSQIIEQIKDRVRKEISEEKVEAKESTQVDFELRSGKTLHPLQWDPTRYIGQIIDVTFGNGTTIAMEVRTVYDKPISVRRIFQQVHSHARLGKEGGNRTREVVSDILLFKNGDALASAATSNMPDTTSGSPESVFFVEDSKEPNISKVLHVHTHPSAVPFSYADVVSEKGLRTHFEHQVPWASFETIVLPECKGCDAIYYTYNPASSRNLILDDTYESPR